MELLTKMALTLTLADEVTKLEQQVDECLPEDFEQKAYLRGKFEIINRINNILKESK